MAEVSGDKMDTSGSLVVNDQSMTIELTWTLVFTVWTPKLVCFGIAGDSRCESMHLWMFCGSRGHLNAFLGLPAYGFIAIAQKSRKDQIGKKMNFRKSSNILCSDSYEIARGGAI